MSAICLQIFAGCSAAKVEPLPAMPEPPKYVQVPHPEGLEHGDLLAIFTESGAPAPETMAGCDSEFTRLRKATASRDELSDGARELVRRDATGYHWCFYSTLLNLEKKLKETPYVDERQKLILEAYLFLTPVARAFKVEYQDSRYLRWAVSRYQRLSEYVFYRRLEPTPQTNAEIMGAATPFGANRPPLAADRGVLDKYGIAAPGPATPPQPNAAIGQLPPAPPGSMAAGVTPAPENSVPVHAQAPVPISPAATGAEVAAQQTQPEAASPAQVQASPAPASELKPPAPAQVEVAADQPAAPAAPAAAPQGPSGSEAPSAQPPELAPVPLGDAAPPAAGVSRSPVSVAPATAPAPEAALTPADENPLPQ